MVAFRLTGEPDDPSTVQPVVTQLVEAAGGRWCWEVVGDGGRYPIELYARRQDTDVHLSAEATLDRSGEQIVGAIAIGAPDGLEADVVRRVIGIADRRRLNYVAIRCREDLADGFEINDVDLTDPDAIRRYIREVRTTDPSITARIKTGETRQWIDI